MVASPSNHGTEVVGLPLLTGLPESLPLSLSLHQCLLLSLSRPSSLRREGISLGLSSLSQASGASTGVFLGEVRGILVGKKGRSGNNACFLQPPPLSQIRQEHRLPPRLNWGHVFSAFLLLLPPLPLFLPNGNVTAMGWFQSGGREGANGMGKLCRLTGFSLSAFHSLHY